MASLGARVHLLRQFAARDFKRRYVGSLLGWLWALVHPLVLLAVYTLVFRHAFGARLPPEEATDSYPLFLLAGMLPWLLFSETLTRSATSLAEHSDLIKKSVFPSETIPASILVSSGAVHLLSVAILLAATLASGHAPGLSLAVLPVYACLLGLLSLGLGLGLAALQVYVRDTAQVLQVALIAWFWLTPVFLPESFYRGALGAALDWNPVRYAVRGYRAAAFGSPAPRLGDLLVLGAFAVAALAGGALFFRRAKRGFADVM